MFESQTPIDSVTLIPKSFRNYRVFGLDDKKVIAAVTKSAFKSKKTLCSSNLSSGMRDVSKYRLRFETVGEKILGVAEIYPNPFGLGIRRQ